MSNFLVANLINYLFTCLLVTLLVRIYNRNIPNPAIVYANPIVVCYWSAKGEAYIMLRHNEWCENTVLISMIATEQ